MKKTILIALILLIILISCKKEEVCNKPTYWYYYYKHNGSEPTDYLGYGYISQCDKEKVREFWDNIPAGYEGAYDSNR